METAMGFINRIRDRYASITVYYDSASQSVKVNEGEGEGFGGIVRRFTSVFIRRHTFYSERQIVADGVGTMAQVVTWHDETGNLWDGDSFQWRSLRSLEEAIRLSQLITAKLLVPSLFDHPFLAFNTVHRVKEESIDDHSCEVLEIGRPRDTIHLWVDKEEIIVRRVDHILSHAEKGSCLRRLDYTDVYAH